MNGGVLQRTEVTKLNERRCVKTNGGEFTKRTEVNSLKERR